MLIESSKLIRQINLEKFQSHHTSSHNQYIMLSAWYKLRLNMSSQKDKWLRFQYKLALAWADLPNGDDVPVRGKQFLQVEQSRDLLQYELGLVGQCLVVCAAGAASNTLEL